MLYKYYKLWSHSNFGRYKTLFTQRLIHIIFSLINSYDCFLGFARVQAKSFGMLVGRRFFGIVCKQFALSHREKVEN